jgi:cell wall-associated NlpC family hydrolase
MKHTVRLVAAVCLLQLTVPLTALASKTHVVTRSGETLQGVARKYRVSVNELKSVNSLSSSKLRKGDSLIIPTQADDGAKTIENCSTYKVTRGDTLFSIARKTGVKVAVLRKANGLKANRIKPGQILALGIADSNTQCELPTKTASRQRLRLVNKDLLNEHEIANTLAELTDINAEQPVDLAKNLESSKAFADLQKSAYSFLGARYRFGGNSPTALDCSSFTQQVFRLQDIDLPRTAREQFQVGDDVGQGDLRRGDLVFFRTYARYASHVGIYLGNRKMIHASSSERRVVISSMDTPYYLSRYLGARRFDKVSPTGLNLDSLILEADEELDADSLTNDHLGVGQPEARLN